MNHEFPKEWHYVSREMHTIQWFIFSALTDLRKTNVDNKGAFYSFFTAASIGLERYLKILLILDYMANNALRCPDRSYIKSKGHNIVELLSACHAIAQTAGIKCDLTFTGNGGRKLKIIEVLKDYAMGGLRYYNIDSLSSGNTAYDPMVKWKEILGDIYDNEVSGKVKTRLLRNSRFIEHAMQNSYVMIAHGLDTRPHDLESALKEQSVIWASSQIVSRHVIEIIKEINVLSDYLEGKCLQASHERGDEMPIIPYIHEFMGIFANKVGYLAKKTRWP